MNLSKKKKLAERTFGVGRERIVFIESRLADIKEAITKQDMRDLYNDGAIIIKGIKGKRKVVGNRRRGIGKIRKVVGNRKKNYITITRKLRRYASDLKRQGKMSEKNFKEIRKKIRNREFRSRAQLKEYLEAIQK